MLRKILRLISERVWLVGFGLLTLAWAYPSLRDLALGIEVTAAERGYQVALRSGCFTCHGPDGVGGVKNPGSEDDEVPGFTGGVPMMWASSEDELREYILDGAPARKRNDPAWREKIQGWLLVMPAYRRHLSTSEVEDLIVYLRAVSGLVALPDDLVSRGHELAVELGCFHCHGPMGARGPANPGSFKGYIPGWWGEDFRELVRDDEELREWIRDGSIARLRDNPLARRFLRRQRVYMPAYGPFLKEGQMEALVAYVNWVSSGEGQNRPLDLSH